MSGPEEFVDALGDALRSVRHARSLSQRDLAHRVGMAKSTIARLESGALPSALLVVHRLLHDLGFELSILDHREAGERLSPEEDLGDDEEGTAIVARWRERVDEEDVRDAAGRRTPAHRHVFPIRVPRRWWVARHPEVPWVRRPLWSFSRDVTWGHVVHRLGRFPSYVGLHPVGGAPMQGYPPRLAGAP